MSSRKDRSADDIRRSTERLQRARKQPGASPLRGIGAFGMIGWSVAVPAVAGAFLGLWLNKVAPQNFSWPIALILGGIVVGIMIAWNWIDKETPKAEGGDKHKDSNRGDKHDG